MNLFFIITLFLSLNYINCNYTNFENLHCRCTPLQPRIYKGTPVLSEYDLQFVGTLHPWLQEAGKKKKFKKNKNV